MALISLQYALFVLACLVVYYLLPGRLQNPFLLLASYYFYSTWNWWYVLALGAATLFNFWLAKGLSQSNQRRRYWLWAGIGINLGFFLGFLFTIPIGGFLKAAGWVSFVPKILLPIGFGYRALECISYLIDVHLKLIKPSENLIDFALYLAYFPKLISGPIERARRFLPLLGGKRTLDNQGLTHSLLLILLGLAQSVILAGMLSVFVPVTIIERPQNHSNIQLVVAMLAFIVYIYNQFAGYTNLVRGVSGLFGIEMVRNFAFPIFSRDFSDFWKRWHISLSQWLRDYIYLPLSRAFLRRNPSRTNVANLILPPLATMLASGVWHGGSLNLLVWGALNGFYIVLENVLSLYRRVSPGEKKPVWRESLSRLSLFGLAFLAAIPFHLSLATSKVFLYQLIFGWDWKPLSVWPFLIIGTSLAAEWYQARHGDETVFLRWPRWVQALTAATAILLIIAVYNFQNAPATFIYP